MLYCCSAEETYRLEDTSYNPEIDCRGDVSCRMKPARLRNITAQVIKIPYLMPKACVQQMQHSVLLTTHIKVYGEPALALLPEDFLAVLSVREAQIIPATASPLHAR